MGPGIKTEAELLEWLENKHTRDPLFNVDMVLPKQRMTVLYYATITNCCSVVKWLLEHGADVNAGDQVTEWTPMCNAVEFGKCDVAEVLFEGGAPITKMRSIGGMTHLHRAAFRGKRNMCKLLLSQGVPFDAADDEGRDAETFARGKESSLLNFVGGERWHLTDEQAKEMEREAIAISTAVDLLADVRVAGGWKQYIAAPRAELLAFRRELPNLRRRGASSVAAHERLFLDANIPDDVFSHILSFWRSDRDYEVST
jgi:phage terminase Nu1 subunit (DNA packaging protein)